MRAIPIPGLPPKAAAAAADDPEPGESNRGQKLKSEWQIVDGSAPARVREIANAWKIGVGAKFFVFYGNNQELYCIGKGPDGTTDVFWLELPHLG
jgi:hypothetical protein